MGNLDGALGGSIGVIIIGSIPTVIVALIGWFILKFVFKSVMSGKEIEVKHALIVWLVIFLILFSFPLFRNKQSGISQPQVSNEYTPSVPIFEAINNARAKKGMPSLQIDERLCAYAKRRALQYVEKDEQVKGQRFEQLPVEDTEEINKSYFKDFDSNNEAGLKVGLASSENIAEEFTNEPNKAAAILSLTHGCVAEEPTKNGTGTWTIFIGGVKS